MDDFFAEVSDMVKDITTSSGKDIPLLKRQIHTVKGNASLFGTEFRFKMPVSMLTDRSALS